MYDDEEFLAPHTPPCLPGLPLFSNIFAIRNERFALLEHISRTYEDIEAFHFGPTLVPALNSPELIHQILIEQEAALKPQTHVRWEPLFLARARF